MSQTEITLCLIKIIFFSCLLFITSLVHSNDLFDFDLSDTNTETQQETQNEFRISGAVELRHRYLTAQEQTLSNRASVNLDLRWQRDNWLLFAKTQTEYDGAKRDYRDAERFELREAYLQYTNNQTNLSIGKQRIAWSTSDGVGTIDRLNAVDLRDPISDARTPSRRPSWLLRWEQSFSLGTLEAVWLPRGKDRKLPEFNSPWELSFLNQLRQRELLGDIDLLINDPESDDYGLRFSRFGQGFDWSMAFFEGYGDGPEQLLVNGRQYTLTPVRSRSVNLSGAIGLSRSTIRGELTWTPNAFIDGERREQLQAVIGIDRTFFTDLYTNLQGFWFVNQSTDDEYGVTFVISNKFFDTAMEAGIRGQFGRDQQVAAELYADYQWDDSLKISGKFVSFDGNAGTGLGEFRANDFIELGVSWSF